MSASASTSSSGSPNSRASWNARSAACSQGLPVDIARDQRQVDVAEFRTPTAFVQQAARAGEPSLSGTWVAETRPMQIGEISGDQSCPPEVSGVLPLAECQLPLAPRAGQVVIEEEEASEQLVCGRIRSRPRCVSEVTERRPKIARRKRGLRRSDQGSPIHGTSVRPRVRTGITSWTAPWMAATRLKHPLGERGEGRLPVTGGDLPAGHDGHGGGHAAADADRRRGWSESRSGRGRQTPDRDGHHEAHLAPALGQRRADGQRPGEDQGQRVDHD